jgi:predicted neuraminidase
MFVFPKDAFFNSCHASTVARLADGTLVCAWFAGTKESAPDVDIWQSRWDGERWSDPRVVVGCAQALWNPVLFAEGEELFLFYRRGVNVPAWESLVVRSTDGGCTYGKPELLPKGFLGPIKNKPVRMGNGEWLCGSSIEPEWECRMEVYAPAIGQWIHSAPVAVEGLPDGKGLIQPGVWESTPGCVHALMRSSEGHVYRADSADYGRTWAPPVATTLPNNNSGLDATRLEDGRVALVYNPVEKNWGPRTPLHLVLSEDNGTTWGKPIVLEDEPGEYSYPGIIPVPGGLVTCYTHRRKQIRVRQFSLSELP